MTIPTIQSDIKKIKVKFYGPLRDVVGAAIIEVDIHRDCYITLENLKDFLSQRFPMLSKYLDTTVIFINNTIVYEDTFITSQDEISLLPPVSGG